MQYDPLNPREWYESAISEIESVISENSIPESALTTLTHLIERLRDKANETSTV